MHINDILSCFIGLNSGGPKKINSVHYLLQSHLKFTIVLITNKLHGPNYLQKRICKNLMLRGERRFLLAYRWKYFKFKLDKSQHFQVSSYTFMVYTNDS